MIQKTMPFFWTINLNTIVPELKPIRFGFIQKARQGERIYHENGHAVTLSASGGGLGGKTGSKIKFVDFILMNVNNLWGSNPGLLPICSQ